MSEIKELAEIVIFLSELIKRVDKHDEYNYFNNRLVAALTNIQQDVIEEMNKGEK